MLLDILNLFSSSLIEKDVNLSRCLEGIPVKHSFSFVADLSNGAVKKEASTKEVARIWINDIKMRSFSPTMVSNTNG